MRFRLRNGLAVVAWVICGSLACAATSVTVNKVWPDKLVYGFDAPVTVTVTVKNTAKEAGTGRLRVILINRLTQEETLYDQEVSLAAGETKEAPVSFRTGKKAAGSEYGYEVRAVISAKGQADSVAREFFMVTDNPLKIGHLTIPAAQTDHRQWPLGLGVDHMREMYFCMAETAFWAPCNFSELTTQREFWTSGGAGRFMSLKGMQAQADGVHAMGGWIVIYCDKWAIGPVGFEHARQHPEWYHWGQDWYGCKFDVEMLDWVEEDSLKDGKWKDQRGGGGWWCICPLIARPEIAEFGISQIVGSMKQFDWDGIRLDNAGWYVDNVNDIFGNPAVKPGTDIPKLEVDLVRRIKAAGRKVKPHFVYGDNVGWFTSLTDATPKWLAEAEGGGLVMMEGMIYVTASPGSDLNRWAYLREYLRDAIPTVRKAGGYPYGIVGPAGDRVWAVDRQPVRPDVVILYAVLMGSGMHLCYHAAVDYYPYMRLYARYCGLLYDDALQFVPDPEPLVAVTSPGPVWWKEYVRRRELPDGKTQFIVHLINPSTGERYDEQKNAAPAPQKDIRVALTPPDGIKVQRAFRLTADGLDGPDSLALPVEAEGGKVTVTVPELAYWNIVVFEGRR